MMVRDGYGVLDDRLRAAGYLAASLQLRHVVFVLTRIGRARASMVRSVAFLTSGRPTDWTKEASVKAHRQQMSSSRRASSDLFAWVAT
jgi:hypothetical protein